MGVATSQGLELFYEEQGEGEPILLIHPGGGTSATWGAVLDDLAKVGRVITYDRRGYGRTGGEPGRSIPAHTVDAAAILDIVGGPPAVVAGVSIGATIAIDLALRRPDLVRAVIAAESPWHARQHPDPSAAETFTTMQQLAGQGRHAEAAETFLRWVYAYHAGGSAWDAFPETWRRIARENGKATISDVRAAADDYPRQEELARITTPVVCTYGARGHAPMPFVARALADAIPGAKVREIAGAGHAQAFDAPAAFMQVIIDAMHSPSPAPGR